MNKGAGKRRRGVRSFSEKIIKSGGQGCLLETCKYLTLNKRRSINLKFLVVVQYLPIIHN